MDQRFAIAAICLAVGLVSCGGDEHRDQRLLPSRTGRYELTVVADEPSQSRSLRASGAFDDERQRYSLSTEVSNFVPGLDGSLAIVATPDAIFVDCPYLTRMLAAPTKWIMVRGPASEPMRSMIDGLVHTTPMRFADGSDGGSAHVALEYFDVGAPVVIEPPAADQVTDETDAFNRLFGGTTGG